MATASNLTTLVFSPTNMTSSQFNQLSEKDRTVLACLQDGAETTTDIRTETTLSNRQVNYCLDKLETQGLIETWTPDGRVTQVIDGQKRNHKAPRHAELTDKGEDCPHAMTAEESPYQDLSHDELVERVRDLERQVDDLEQALETFRQQVWRRL